MFYVDGHGYIDDKRIVLKIFNTIERGKLDKVNGIVVHQTGSSTSKSTFNSYKNKSANGAHFLIDKDGTIYQTASLYRVTWHVGKSQSRCFIARKCEPTEFKSIFHLEQTSSGKGRVSKMEQRKSFPDRYPINIDSIGIEIVGAAPRVEGKPIIYEPVNDKQNASLKWLVKELAKTLAVPLTEVYRHPEIGRKNETEASTAQW
ncbi:peptidoglycan recognition protein family protein [Rouxiella sp. Mn2063]|uniref:peptidoglycan recognition protein family protein n=1 Tax=Rouxiella sp. Mn2063 TaxID=3395262 RepID=UPI003BD681D8